MAHRRWNRSPARSIHRPGHRPAENAVDHRFDGRFLEGAGTTSIRPARNSPIVQPGRCQKNDVKGSAAGAPATGGIAGDLRCCHASPLTVLTSAADRISTCFQHPPGGGDLMHPKHARPAAWPTRWLPAFLKPFGQIHAVSPTTSLLLKAAGPPGVTRSATCRNNHGRCSCRESCAGRSTPSRGPPRRDGRRL